MSKTIIGVIGPGESATAEDTQQAEPHQEMASEDVDVPICTGVGQCS